MSMPSPSAGIFPAATGGLFPVSPVASNPMFGVNPFTPGQTKLGTTQYINPDLGLPDLAARHAAQMQQIQMAQLSSMGLAPATDPHTWTPEEAVAQTGQAIAKIGAVNPDLAQQLAEQRAPDPAADDGNSFWDSLKHVAGEVLTPALNIGGRVLDIIGRTAYIVPNVAFDLADGGKTDVWGDIGGALTGNTKHNWNSVFQEMGWEGDGIGGFLRATVGLTGDILTDPLTWIIPAGAGVKSAEASAHAGEEVAVHAGSLVAEGEKVYGLTDNALGEKMMGRYREVSGMAEEHGVQLGGSDTAERLTALIGNEAHEGEIELLRKQFELSGQVYDLNRSRSLSTYLAKKGGFYGSDGELIASGSDVKTALNDAVARGGGALHGSDEWSHARSIASSMGGSRFKVAVPFTQLRYISPALPGSRFLSEKSFGFLARMASGMSGMNRMADYLATHPEEGWAPMKNWMEQGFEAALKENPEMVNQLRGKFKNMGSMFYSASEQMGRLTAHFDSTAAATRSGLAGYFAVAAKTKAANELNRWARETAYAVKDRNGNSVNREQLLRKIESNLGISFRKRHNVASYADRERYADYVDAFPHDLDTSDPAAIEAWWASQPQNAIGPQTAEEAAKREDELRHIQEVAASMTPGERETLDLITAINHHMRNEVAKADASYGDVGMGFGEVGKLTPEQAAQAAADSQVPETLWFTPTSTQQALRVKQVGITADEASAQGDFVGLHFDLGPNGAPVGPGAVPVRIKVSHPIYMDESEAGALLDEKVGIYAQESSDAVAASADLVDAHLGRPLGTTAATGEDRQKAAAMITEQLRKENPEADSIIIKGADGQAVHVVVFDQSQAWAVDEGAANMVAKRGFLHRTLTPEAKEWLRGKAPREGTKLLIAEPELEAFLRRQTLHMNRREAEHFMRTYLTDLYGADGLPEQIWENDILKVHEHYVKTTGEAIVSEQLGRSARRIVQLGDLAPQLFGSAPRDQRYEWQLNSALLNSLTKKDAKLTKAILHSHDMDARRVEAQHAELAKSAEQFGVLQALVEESLGYGVPVPDRFISAARKYGETVHKAQAKIDKNLAGLDDTEGHLVTQLISLDEAYARVPEGDAVAHPKSADIIVTANEDGTQSVKGWHYSKTGGGVEPVRGVDPEELGSAGFHIGSYDQSKFLADLDAQANERTIGSRDGHDWNQTIVVKDTDGNVVASIDGRDIRRKPNESLDEAAVRQAREEDALAASNNLLGGAEPIGDRALTVEYVPQEPQMFYEDVIVPVEARGKFTGTPERPLIEGPREAGDSTLGMAFTGSGTGSTVEKTIDRARIEAMDGGGTQGAIYQNAVESGGNSLVILDPRDGSVVWNAATGNGGKAQFEQAVADGKVFLTKDGKVTTKRVAGSKRLKPRDQILDQLSRVRAEKEQLRELQTQLRKGLPGAADKKAVTEFDSRIADEALNVKALKETLSDEAALRAQYDDYVRSNWAVGLKPSEYQSWEEYVAGYKADLTNAESRLKAMKAQRAATGSKPVEESAASLGRDIAARAARESQAALAAGKRLEKLRRKTHDAMNEANKAYSEFHGALAKTKPSLVKVETAGNLGGLTRLHIPGLEGFAMPAYIAEEFHQLVDTKGIGHLRESWRKYVMGPWKRWATYRWPGFHVRNFFGAFFNNWLGGVVERDYVFSWRVNHARDGQLKWADRLVSDFENKNYHLTQTFGHTPTYAEVADLLSKQGVGRANTMAVMGIGAATEATHEALAAVGKKNANIGRRAVRRADDVMKAMGSSVEDFHRVAAWGRGMASTNGDTYGARAFVMMRHGDYADLTGAEDFIRDLVPFYKWQRTNIPYQLRMLAENPAKLSLVHDKIPGWAYDAQGINRREAELQQPDWMKQSTAIPVPSWMPVIGSKDKDALKFAMFDLPYSDLYNGLNDYLSSGLPIVRNVLESYGFKQTLFSGKALDGKYVPLSGVFNIPGVRDILHTAGLTQRGADGQEYMQDKVQNVLMAWPIFSRFRNFTESNPERVDARVGGLFSMMAGVGIREGDYTSAELDFYYNEVQPLLDQYKSLGIQLPTTDDLQSGEVGAQVGLFGGSAAASPFLTGSTAA